MTGLREHWLRAVPETLMSTCVRARVLVRTRSALQKCEWQFCGGLNSSNPKVLNSAAK